VAPGSYRVGFAVQGVRTLKSEEPLFDVLNAVTGLTLSCPAEIAIPDTPANGSLVSDGLIAAPLIFVPVCEVKLQPDDLPQPQPSLFKWRSSSVSKATIQASTEGPTSALTARDIGSTTISASLETTGSQFVLGTSNEVVVQVGDGAKPRISIASATTSPVAPGGTIVVTVTASDNNKLSLVQLNATGDAVASGASQQAVGCAGKKSCSEMFTVTLKESGFDQNTVTIQAEATDLSLHSASSNTLSFAIARDDTCPSLSIQQPASGGTVNAGETTTVVAVARDDGPTDTGVASFSYSASGPALTAQVSVPSLPLPMPQASPTLRFNFTVKQPSELTDVEDKTIVISVDAFDAAKPPNHCGAQTISVGVIGVLDRCQGGISVDNPSGFIDEPFTITVALAGEGADEITRVISINPGGQFDLESQGGNVYTVTLFYQGTGAFTLRFVALDAAGEERCAGSIGLESLGPEDEAAATSRGDAEPAGAGLLR